MDDNTSSTPSFRYRWDVFLSFRGEDTRHNFTESLYKELVGNGIRTFRDEEELERGEEIDPSLLEAIQDSAVAIAVISTNYASSRWCLEELARIVDCRKLILPVFYNVDPLDVRRQKGPFEKDFVKLVQSFGEDKVARWRGAMQKAGDISGWDSRLWDEQQLIQSLVKRVLSKLSKTPLGVAKYPVGLSSRLEELMGIIDVKANGVRIVGLHGMGGVGKTTLAESLYNKLVVHFKHRSFISNVRETAGKSNGLVDLQNKLIDDLSSNKTEHGNDISRNILEIKNLIHEEPILVILDDVGDVRQLDVLAVKRNWFYEGSRIIITTRDKEILDESIVNTFYEVKKLNFPESLELFCYHAFGREKPVKNFADLSKQIVEIAGGLPLALEVFAGGLPLALEVFGSFLYDKRRKIEWESALQKLKQIRPGNLQDVLRISYNGLDEEEKCAFLDIACFFVNMRMSREYAIDILKGCGFRAEIVMTVLTARSLVRVIGDNVLWMHDQLRDMGRQIVLEENFIDPSQRSRLWVHNDVIKILKNKKGTRNIQGIALDIEKSRHELSSEEVLWNKFKERPGFTSAIIYLKEMCKKHFLPAPDNGKDVILWTSSFKPMVGLRLLQINNAKLNGNIRYMPADLKWLQWKRCSLRSLPPEFVQHIAVLDLSESKIRKVAEWRWWNWCRRNKAAERLLVMDLHDCSNLTEITDFSLHPVLEKLILENCVSLVKIPNHIGDLSTLRILNLKNCSQLVEFPSDVSGLKNLETFVLSDCSKLKELPEDMSSMKSLRELLIDRTAITKLPESIFRLKELEKLSLKSCWLLKRLPDCRVKLKSLKELSLDGSALEELPVLVGSMESLEILNLMRCQSLTALPDSIGNLKSLVQLLLDGISIKELPDSIGLLSHLKYLSVSHCQSLNKLPDSIKGLVSLVEFQLQCTPIKEVPDEVGSLNLLGKLEMQYCESLESLPESIGKMLNITSLNLENTMITELPESIGMLERLNTLKLNKCKQLQRLPSSIGNLTSLQYLYMEETSVKNLPDEFGMLLSLTILKMRKEPNTGQPQDTGEHSLMSSSNTQQRLECVLPSSFSNLSLLKHLDARAWKLSGTIPDEFEKLSSLEKLDLGYNNFCCLPSSLRGISYLKELVLANCKQLKSLPPLPSSLVKLNVANCTGLENISDLTILASLRELDLTCCTNMKDIPGLQCLKSLTKLYMGGCNACFPVVKGRLNKVALQNLRNLSVPGSEIPDWFVQEIPCFANRRNHSIKGIIIGVVFSLDQSNQDTFRDKLPGIVDIQARIIRSDGSSYATVLDLRGVPNTDEDQLHLCRYADFSKLVLILKEGGKLQIETQEKPYFNGLTLKKYGFHLVFENDDDFEEEDDEESLDEHQQSVSMKLVKFIGSL